MSWATKLTGRVAAGLRRNWIDPQEVRAEAWALGGRHQGRVLEGAQKEMQAPGVSVRRTILLRAVVKSEDLKRLRAS